MLELKPIIRWYLFLGSLISILLSGALLSEMLFLDLSTVLQTPNYLLDAHSTQVIIGYPVIILLFALTVFVSWPLWFFILDPANMLLISKYLPEFEPPPMIPSGVFLLITLVIYLIPFATVILSPRMNVIDFIKKERQPLLLIGTLAAITIGGGLVLLTDYFFYEIWSPLPEKVRIGFLNVFIRGDLLLMTLFVFIIGVFIICGIISLLELWSITHTLRPLSKRRLSIGIVLLAFLCITSLIGYGYLSMFLKGYLIPGTGFRASVWGAGSVAICYCLLLYEHEILTFPSHFKANWTSPFFISMYIILSLVIMAIVLQLNDGQLYIALGGWISLVMTFLLLITIIRSFRNYLKTRIRDYGIFGLLMLSLLFFAVMNIGFIVYVLDLASQAGVSVNFETIWWSLTPDSIFSYIASGEERVIAFAAYVMVIIVSEAGLVIEIPSQIFDILLYLNRGAYFFVHFLFSLYFIRALWFSIPKKAKILAIIIIGLIGTYLLFMYRYFSDPILLSIKLFLDLLLYFYLFIFTYIYLGGRLYKAIDPPHPTSRIITTTKLWRIVLILFSCYSIIIGIIIGEQHFGLLIFLPNIILDPHFYIDIFDMLYILSILLILSSLLLLAYIGIRYPEGMIIFETHLYCAMETYQTAKTLKMQQQKELSFGVIEQYLQQIPPEFFREITAKNI
ncbi:MAG: hypothetical protein ACFFC6_02380 [Promethearchaeota archaeon]